MAKRLVVRYRKGGRSDARYALHRTLPDEITVEMLHEVLDEAFPYRKNTPILIVSMQFYRLGHMSQSDRERCMDPKKKNALVKKRRAGMYYAGR